MKRAASIVLAAGFAAGLAACTYSGGDIGDPVTRKFHWFSFVAGDDVKATCAVGTPDRYRLIYNGIYENQVRIYQVDSLRKVVDVKAIDPGDASRISGDDPAGPWRAVETKTPLDDRTFALLTGQIAEAGLLSPAVGLELPSRSYYWASAICRNGRFVFSGWKYAAPDYKHPDFAATLFGLADAGGPIAAPGPVPFDPQIEDDIRRGERTVFTLKVGANGMVR